MSPGRPIMSRTLWRRLEKLQEQRRRRDEAADKPRVPRRRKPAPDPSPEEIQAFIKGIRAQAEKDLLRRVRDYLAVGRPLATLPVAELRALWVKVSNGVLSGKGRWKHYHLSDLGTEFDLRGIKRPLH